MTAFGKLDAVAHPLSTCTPPLLASSPPHVITGTQMFFPLDLRRFLYPAEDSSLLTDELSWKSAQFYGHSDVFPSHGHSLSSGETQLISGYCGLMPLWLEKKKREANSAMQMDSVDLLFGHVDVGFVFYGLILLWRAWNWTFMLAFHSPFPLLRLDWL